MRLSPYTVILLRPDYLCGDTPYGQDIYVALVKTAGGPKGAIQAARSEVYNADTRDELEPKSKDDYAVCAVFSGHHSPILYGWQE